MYSIASISDGEFNKTVASGVTLVNFWVAGNLPCQQLTPILELVAEFIGNKAKIVRMDIDANPSTPKYLGLSSIPALVLFKDGKRLKQGGALSAVQVAAMIQSAF